MELNHKVRIWNSESSIELKLNETEFFRLKVTYAFEKPTILWHHLWNWKRNFLSHGKGKRLKKAFTCVTDFLNWEEIDC